MDGSRAPDTNCIRITGMGEAAHRLALKNVGSRNGAARVIEVYQNILALSVDAPA